MPIFVPLGIPAFDGSEEKGKIKFTLGIEHNNADKMLLQIRDGAEPFYEEKITDPSMLTEGSHTWYWDGFDENGILDTAFLTKARLNLLMKVWRKDNAEFSTQDFKANYEEVNWVDVKINKNTKRIDVTLRVNLTDGGERGIKCIEKDIDPDPKIRVPMKICPWDKIPEEALSYHKEPIIKNRTKSFEELKQMALDGLNKYWSRHQGNIGKNIKINDEKYEVFVNAINTTDSDNSLDDIPLIYNTNKPWSRSGNPGSSDLGDGNTMDELAKVLPDGVVQRISYNVGYVFHSNWKNYPKHRTIYKNKGWEFNSDISESEDFKETSAHEIGHEIIQAFAGTVYSWQHKGSSYYLPQDAKPVGKESFKEEYINRDFMEETKGENTPKTGEIDLMKYYNDYSNYKDRIIANEKDVISLLWLTKLELK